METTKRKRGRPKLPPRAKAPTQAEMMRAKGYLPVADAASKLGVSKFRIYDLIKRERIDSLAIGDGPNARRYVPIASLREYVGDEAAKVLGL